MDKLNSIHKLKLLDLNPHLMCVLCGGYYIDATTIVECLHSFCRSCIVKHLESSKYCPICEVQVHKTKPLLNIRPDKTLQNIVYKLVPGLFANEMRSRRKFYRERPHYIKPTNSELIGEVSNEIYINDDNITFSLVYHAGSITSSSNNFGEGYREILPPFHQDLKRYFKCPTGVTVYHLKKLLKKKYDLNDNNYKMEIYLMDQPLREELTLLDVSYIYHWKSVGFNFVCLFVCLSNNASIYRLIKFKIVCLFVCLQKGSLNLTCKIFENVIKRQKLEEKFYSNASLTTGMSSREETEGKKERINCTEPKMNEVKREKEEGMEVVGKKKKKNDGESEKLKNGESHGKSDVDNTISRIGEIGKNSSPSDCKKENVQPTGSSCDAHNKTETSKVKENGVVVKEGESKEVQLQISESGVMSVSQVEDGKIVRTLEDAPPKVINNQHLITGLSLGLNKGNDNGGETNGNKVDGNNVDRTPVVTTTTTTTVAAVTPASVATATSTSTAVTESHRKTSTKPVKSYKTIRCAPKTWNPVIPKEKLRPTLMKNSPEEPKKPLKFFKMRNMPRFLGNPSSGVKPLFAHEPQENNNGEEDKKKGQDNKKQQQQPAETVKNKILKIDPKTLRPIEKSTSEDVKVTPTTPTVPNLLTNPFIPNNNHFLFSDLHLLPPNCGNFTNSKFDVKNNDFAPDKSPPTGGIFKNPLPNGSYPPICFPTPDHKSNFYPFSNLTKPQNFPFPVTDKMDPLLRASRLSPFGNLAGFNVAGFHASLPPSISRLLNPHHHFRKINQSLENNNNNNSSSSSSGSGSSSGGSSSNSRKNKDESTKVETKNNATNCDDSLKIITNATDATSGNEKNVSISQGGNIKINNESASIAEVKSIRDNNSHVDDKDTKR
ncbi:polycomb complex protein bmi-1, putative [Pediculus humanus corporis]|uniref:Polycomb complex protein bmi-1, putative n=1 Tax=Pediculus humanus subsp. corporis TaxID=121224 RepID=E0VGV1_PEDHC|nr:polycomb complex protein bmi-1, putative [Pediculus humanus corporis]EEB12607.1 polycomb complex protein bmi-1, putative [Pediculus humanus corporis]